MKLKELTNTQRERLQPPLAPQKPRTGRSPSNHQRLINRIFSILHTGVTWCDLSERYGPLSPVASRFYRWGKAGIWQHLLETVEQQADALSQSQSGFSAKAHL